MICNFLVVLPMLGALLEGGDVIKLIFFGVVWLTGSFLVAGGIFIAEDSLQGGCFFMILGAALAIWATGYFMDFILEALRSMSM